MIEVLSDVKILFTIREFLVNLKKDQNTFDDGMQKVKGAYYSAGYDFPDVRKFYIYLNDKYDINNSNRFVENYVGNPDIDIYLKQCKYYIRTLHLEILV